MSDEQGLVTVRMDERKAERVRESVRTGLAKALAATAQGLASASRAAASTAAQLRPPEPARGRAETATRQRADQAPAAEAAPTPAPSPPRTPPASTETARPATAPATSPATSAPTTAERATDEASSAGAASERGVDVAALVERNARDVIAEIGDLSAAELRRLRTAEQKGKARKTVLAAIDRALGA